MNIMHVINTLSAGGAELHLLGLCQGLQKVGFTPSVVCLKERVPTNNSLRERFECSGIETTVVEADSRCNVRFLERVVRLVTRKRPHLIHTHLPRADVAGAVTKWTGSRVPVVSSVHDIYAVSWSGSWLLPLLDRVWGRADAVIAISHAVENWLVSQRKLAAEKVRVIHYGIDPDFFDVPDFDGARLFRNGALVISSLGRLEPRKGHEYLIRAMPLIRRRCPGAVLRIAGPDPWGHGRKLRALIENLRLGTAVSLVGAQSDVRSFLADSDIFAFASESEGFGQVVLEAMACRKPVVLSRIPPFTEIMTQGEAGLFAEPKTPQAFADAILQIVDHPREAREMGIRGREIVKCRFSMDRVVRDVQALYLELLGK